MTHNGNSYRTQLPEPDWHKIADRASEEDDPKKLVQLVQALCDRLEELQRSTTKGARYESSLRKPGKPSALNDPNR